MSKLTRFVAIACGVVLLLVVILVLTGEVGGPVLYELPDGYVGWAYIDYENPACARLTSRGLNTTVITIPPSGSACTSDRIPRGWRHYRYEYVRVDGERRALGLGDGRPSEPQVWGVYSGPANPITPHPHEGFFVGSEEQFKNAGPATRL